VTDCSRCGRANSPDARFCSNCGATLVTRVAVQERRVVTALFADLASSTALGEQLDPEVMRGIVARFFEMASEQVRSRGGSVEKFSGDAVMALFGLPSAHEDDPERAVRTAVAIRQGVAALAADTDERHAISVALRIGIESGEVVVGDPYGGATMATGDAMNVAARLEQLAAPGEIVIGRQAWEQVRDVVQTEPLGEQVIRGRQATAPGWRLLSVAQDVGRPRGVPGLQAPLTGRDEELALLLGAARRAEHESKTVLFTILGVPGVGKSRLVREALSRLESEGWSVVRGRCLPYGEGITYWPVAEMLRDVAAIEVDTSPAEARRRLVELSPDEEVSRQLALVLGLTDDEEGGPGGTDREIAYAFRRLLEHRAAQHGPHVLLFEDIHWAAPPLLDLIEYLATWAREAPLLVITPSRPELLDTRPGWGSGRMEANRINLEPLSEDESRQLLAALLTVEDLPAELRQRVLDRAEGNPLFVEEVVRMLIEEGVVEHRDGHWYAQREAAEVRVPDTVEALIRARLDTLPAPERAVLQAAAVVGRVFQHSAVTALASDDGEPRAGRVEEHLEDAILRDLITEERSPDERTFRFRHVLIRDVAYTTLPKARRAQLHGLVAAWLRGWARDRIDEFIEIEAYHLEQAVLLRRELDGRADPNDIQAAADALHASALKALSRDDARATLNFAERGLALEPATADGRLELASLSVEALRRLGEWRRSGELAKDVEAEAVRLGRRDIEGRALLARAGDIWISLSTADAKSALEYLERARELLAQVGDVEYLLVALEFLGYGGWWSGDLDSAEAFWLEKVRVAREAGLPSRQAEALTLLAGLYSQRGEVQRRREVLQEAQALAAAGSSRLIRALVERAWATFLATSISEEDAVPILLRVAPVFEEFGEKQELHTAFLYLGDIRRRQGRPAEALGFYEQSLTPVLEHVGYRPEVERRMAQASLGAGDGAAAQRWAEQAVQHAGHDDIATVASTRMTLGLVREAQGRLAEADELLRGAVDQLHGTDYAGWEEHLSLAEFLLRQGRRDEADGGVERAVSAAARYGADSPIAQYVSRRIAAAKEVDGP